MRSIFFVILATVSLGKVDITTNEMLQVLIIFFFLILTVSGENNVTETAQNVKAVETGNETNTAQLALFKKLFENYNHEVIPGKTNVKFGVALLTTKLVRE